MKLTFLKSLLIVLFGVILMVASTGQNLLSRPSQTSTSQSDTAVIQIQPVSQSEITEASSRVFTLLSVSKEQLMPETEKNGYRSQVDTLLSMIDEFFSDTSILRLEELAPLELENYQGRADNYIAQLSTLKKQLTDRSLQSEETIKALNDVRRRWKITLDRAEENDLPETMVERVTRNLAGIDSVRSMVQQDVELILSLLDRTSTTQTKLEAVKSEIVDLKTLSGETLFSRDMPGLIKDLKRERDTIIQGRDTMIVAVRDTLLIQNHINSISRTFGSDRIIFRAQFRKSIVLFFLFFLALLVHSLWYRKNYTRQIATKKFELTDIHLTLIKAPVIVSLFTITALIRFILPDLPNSYNVINSLILVITMFVLTIRLYGSVARPWAYWLMLIYLLLVLYDFIYYPDVIQRVLLLIISSSGAILYVQAFRKQAANEGFTRKNLYHFLRISIGIFAAFLIIAIAGNLIGAFRLSEYFTLMPTQLVITALAVFIVTKVADTYVFLILASNIIQRVNAFREEFTLIHKKLERLINILLWAFFFVITLNLFKIKEPVFEWGRRVLTDGWSLGAVDISLGSILIFIFVIWLSVVISRIVRAILEKDVFTRITTSKGMPSTIIMLVRIALITGGFFLAAAAAGMELTNLSIIIGAFSVGIGFGLQNIFNNLVSGLILAFERPIKVGDTVQVGELTGVVLKIGIRSSTIRSFDGAEVIVPNGNLISDQMINWTLSDSFRRMDLRVGVAYGTDPQTVIDLIHKVAESDDRVSIQPAPKAYFIGFGDSSLDFRLLAWTDIDHRLTVESELAVGINNALKEAGIEIPFPQRDLHIRSDRTKG